MDAYPDKDYEYDENYTDYVQGNDTDYVPGTVESSMRYFQDDASKYLWTYVGPTLMACGTIGHLLIIFIVLGSGRMRVLPISVYMAAMSASGILAIHSGLLRYVILFISDETHDVRSDVSEAGCKFHILMTYSMLQLYSWIQASIAAERFVSVHRPIWYRKCCTRKVNCIVLAVEFVLLLAANAGLAVAYGYDHEEQDVSKPPECRNRDLLVSDVYRYIDLVLFSVIPAAIMIPCNIATVNLIRQSRTVSNACQKARPITFMLLSQNGTFLITTLPISVIIFANWDGNGEEDAAIDLWWTSFYLLQYMGISFTFLVYCATGSKFRKAIADLFRKGFQVPSSAASSFTRTSYVRTSIKKSSSEASGQV